MTNIEGAVAVVTGGASGIGRAVAVELIGAGAAVVIGDIDPRVEAAASEIGAIGVRTDVSDPASVDALARRALEAHGRVDILVNNAGVGSSGRIVDLTLEDWRWMFGINVFGAIHGVRAFYPLLAANARGGHIVNVASMASFDVRPAFGAYGASKAALASLTEALAAELAVDAPEVKVTLALPGPTETEIARSLRHRPADEPTGLREVDLANVPTGRGPNWIAPEIVARAIVDAIRADSPFAVTHPEQWHRVQDRIDRLRLAFDDAEAQRGAGA